MILRKLLLIAVGALLVLAGGNVAAADDDPLDYSDPGMHFRPPDGWERVTVQNVGPDQNGISPPVAVYVSKKNKQDQRIITISVQPFGGTLDGFLTNHTSELRQQGDSTFVEKQEKTTLANTMPAYWLKVNQGTAAGHFVRRYEYVVIDLTRGIVVTYLGRAGDFDEKEAKAALSSLYVVVYPRRRP